MHQLVDQRFQLRVVDAWPHGGREEASGEPHLLAVYGYARLVDYAGDEAR